MAGRGTSRTRSQRSTKAKSTRKGPQAGRMAGRDSGLTESEKNRLAFEATERFIRSGGDIKDVYGKLDG